MPGQKAPEETRREDIMRAAYDVAARRGVEAITVRAVAERADVSHGTVLFYFTRRDELVANLLDRVLDATAELRTSETVSRLEQPAERLHALLRAEMERLSSDPRPFRVFLEYWALGVRSAAIRRKISAALQRYRASLTEYTAPAVAGRPRPRRGSESSGLKTITPDGVAAVAVSLIHGCALQSVIDPAGFDVQQHFDAAAQMLRQVATPDAATPRS
jgi:TetR/AcrR family transcriptional repressor of bet genes